jgi:hypothetical protein
MQPSAMISRDCEQLAPRLSVHPLSSWVDYWRLRIRLNDRRQDGNPALETEVERQLAQGAGTLTADLLRRDWIVNLGGAAMRQGWTTISPVAAARGCPGALLVPARPDHTRRGPGARPPAARARP